MSSHTISILKQDDIQAEEPRLKNSTSSTTTSKLYIICEITIIFAIVRIIQYGLVFLTPSSQFDTSTQLLLDVYTTQEEQNQFINRNILNKLLSWDSVFFIKGMLSSNSMPSYEHEFAFSIIWNNLIKYIYKYLKNDGTRNLYDILLLGIIIENLLHYISILVLYQLTFLTFSPTKSNHSNNYAASLAKKTSILFIFTSAAGFLLGIYSEPLSFFLSFSGMLAREYCISDVTFKNPFSSQWQSLILYTIVSTFCFTIATINRSNCILLGIFYLYDFHQLVKLNYYKKAMIFPFLSGLIMLLSVIIQQYYIPYKQFCPDRREWCSDPISKLYYLSFLTKQSLYSYIQSHYWDVGFLKYWTLNNIPNFLFAIPNLIIIAYASFYYTWIYPYSSLKPIIIISNIFLFVMLFIANVQIINRVSSFIPLHLWYIADRLIKISSKKITDSHPKNDDILVKAYIYWIIIWIPLQTILFANFLPPA